MASELDRLCDAYKVRIENKYGVAARLEPKGETGSEADWRRTAHAWTCTLRYKGRRMTVPFWQGSAITEEPTAADVLSCLISDTTGYENAQSFENWVDDLGMDPDSRKAYATWQAVKRIAPKVRRFLGDDFAAFAQAEH